MKREKNKDRQPTHQASPKPDISLNLLEFAGAFIRMTESDSVSLVNNR